MKKLLTLLLLSSLSICSASYAGLILGLSTLPDDPRLSNYVTSERYGVPMMCANVDTYITDMERFERWVVSWRKDRHIVAKKVAIGMQPGYIFSTVQPDFKVIDDIYAKLEHYLAFFKAERVKCYTK